MDEVYVSPAIESVKRLLRTARLVNICVRVLVSSVSVNLFLFKLQAVKRHVVGGRVVAQFIFTWREAVV